MPLMFGMFALSFSIGLSIYFIVSNLAGIAQYSPIGKRVLERAFGGQKDKAAVVEVVQEEPPVEEKKRKRKKRKQS
jgi:membrane protein insertase Oxa1/YidC/SpoIIIJ